METKRLVGKAGLAAIIGCAACCAIPLVAAAGAGGGLAGTVSSLFRPGTELVVAAVVFVVSLAVLVVRARRTNEGCGPSCKTDGSCCDRGVNAV